MLEIRENGEAFVAINDRKEEAQHDEIDENGEASVAAINTKKEEARHKIVNPINLFEESKDEEEEEELNNTSRKNLLEIRKNGEAFVSINATEEESKKKEEDELNRSGRKKVTFDPNVSIYDDGLLANHVCANCSEINPSTLQKQNGAAAAAEEEVNEHSNSSVSSYISYPPNHRYYCCRNSYDEFEDIDLEDDANNNDNNNENDDDVECSGNGLMIQEESSSNESLFSLSLDSTRRGNYPMPEMSDKEEVNSPLKQSVRLSVLKDPGITTPPSLLKKAKQQEKENIDMNLLDFCITYNQRVQEEPSLKRQEKEVAVDTSLSSWLVASSQDDTPNSKNTAGSVGNSPPERRVRLVDGPILGALTVEELKDEKKHTVIGTVGSYLRHTGQATGISSC